MRLSDATKKKPEMVRRSRVVKFVEKHAQIYEQMQKVSADDNYLKGYADLLNYLTDEFDVGANEYRS